MDSFSNENFCGGAFLAARNQAFLSDVFVWTEGYFIKYNSRGEIEEVGNKSITERANFKIENIRPACQIEVFALRYAVLNKFDKEI